MWDIEPELNALGRKAIREDVKLSRISGGRVAVRSRYRAVCS
jgi:hypothetical protein